MLKKNPDFFFYLFLLLLGGAGLVYYLNNSSKKQPQEEDLSQPASNLTLEQKIQQRTQELHLQKRVQEEEIKAEKFEKPPENIDPLEPESADLDRGIHFPENNAMKEVFEDLKKHPYKSDMDKDPEHIARRQAEHQQWLEEHLKQKNETEREEFIKKFVQLAREQGYQVHWTKDMKVLLRPIEPEESAEEEPPEEIKVIYE